MGAASALCCGSGPVLEPGNQMLADKLGIDNHTLNDLRERFYDCCEEVGGVMTIGAYIITASHCSTESLVRIPRTL